MILLHSSIPWNSCLFFFTPVTYCNTIYKQKTSLQKTSHLSNLDVCSLFLKIAVNWSLFHTVFTYLRNKIMQCIHGFHNCHLHHSNLLLNLALIPLQHICEGQGCPNLLVDHQWEVSTFWNPLKVFGAINVALQFHSFTVFFTIISGERTCSAKATCYKAVLNYCRHDGVRRSQRRRGLRHRSAAAHLLGLWVQIPQRAWMSLFWVLCVVR